MLKNCLIGTMERYKEKPFVRLSCKTLAVNTNILKETIV